MDEKRSYFFVSAAIVTYNNGSLAAQTVKSLLENTKRYKLKLYVFDNASTDNTAEIIKSFKDVDLTVLNKNIGFAAAHNLILNKKAGKYHFIINPDILLKSDVISDMVDFLEANEDTVMAMPQILNNDGSIQYLPKEVPTFKSLFFGRLFSKIRNEYVWKNKDINGVRDICFCSGCFFCIKSEAFKKLGGFDQRFFMYLEDADLTLRAKKYGRTVINTDFSVIHKWQRTSSKNLKYLVIHILSAFKFLKKKEKMKK